MLNLQLEDRQYLAGDYSIADIANWAWVRSHEWAGVAIEPFENLRRWCDELAGRPVGQRGVEIPPRAHRTEDPAEAQRFITEARRMLRPAGRSA